MPSLLTCLLGATALVAPCLSSALPSSNAWRSPTQQWQTGQEVDTTSGIVEGHHAPWPENSGVSEYLGIPYAQAPIGNMRFMAPKALSGRGKKISGLNWSQECVQLVQGSYSAIEEFNGNPPKELLAFAEALGGPKNATFGEDCLKLNVWTKPQEGEKGKAVMLWIYGGAYAVGSTSAYYYNPARYAAEHDVVVISINYRTSVFGFPGTTFLPENNLGLLDQRLAVEWVRDNVAGFGGDPKRITLFGESAGGASVDYYSYAWVNDPIVNGFIAQSGTSPGLNGNAPDDARWYQVSKSAGCGDGTTGTHRQSLDCMRNISTEKLLNASKTVATTGGLTSYWPVVDNKTFFADTWDREVKGIFIKRPMLVGNLDHEGDIISGAANEMIKWAAPQWNRLGLAAQGGKQVLNLLTTSDNPAIEAMRWFLRFIEDGVFNCPAGESAKARAAQGVPVWRYRFMGQWPNIFIGGQGAYHVSDVPLTMGTTERKKGAAKNGVEEEKLVKNVMNAWATFAKDPDNGLTKLGWPRYDPKGNTLIRLGFENSGTPSFGPSQQYDENCPAQRHVQPSDLRPIIRFPNAGTDVIS